MIPFPMVNQRLGRYGRNVLFKFLQGLGFRDFPSPRIAINKAPEPQVVHDEITDILQQGLAVLINKGGFELKGLGRVPHIERLDHSERTVIDDQTLIKQDGAEVGVPHFFSYYENLLEFFKEFEIKEVYYKEYYGPKQSIEAYQNKKGWGHFIYLIQKPE